MPKKEDEMRRWRDMQAVYCDRVRCRQRFSVTVMYRRRSQSLACSYGARVKQARGPSYVAHLENQVWQLEALISDNRAEPKSSSDALRGSAGIPTPSSSGSGLRSTEPSIRPMNSWSGITPPFATADVQIFQASQSSTTTPWPNLINMTPLPPDDNVGSLGVQDFLEPIECEQGDVAMPNLATSCFYGNSSGLEILRRMGIYLESMTGTASAGEVSAGTKLARALDRPLAMHLEHPVVTSSVIWRASDDLLQSVDTAFSEVFCLWPVADRSTVVGTVEWVYTLSTFDHTGVHRDRLALLYAIAVLGDRYRSGSRGCLSPMNGNIESHE